MDFFFNNPEHVVDEGLIGLSRTAPVRISQADSGLRLVVARDPDPDKVAVIAGGGSGHEPSHAGFVGPGMLTAAVAGDLFTSPSVDAVLAAIREVTGPAGCLLIIKNYTGDRLNFGLAAERAIREGYRVRSVIVADDVSLPEDVSARGLAGTVLVHKVAGHHAAIGDDLDTVAGAAEAVRHRLLSIGLSLSSATLPGQKHRPRPPELGLGIHNEPGVRQVAPKSATDAVTMALTPLLKIAHQAYPEHTEWAVLLNNLGGCSSQEMGVLTHETVRQLPKTWQVPSLIGGTLMSSMNMHGFSITFLPLTASIQQALASTTTAPGWPGTTSVHATQRFVPSYTQPRPTETGSRDPALAAYLQSATQALKQARDSLNALDARIGDGDTGTAFARGAEAIEQALRDDRLSTGDPARLAEQVGDILSHDMGGSSGALLAILCTAMASAWPDAGQPGLALQQGIARVQEYGGARAGDRTFLDALMPAAGQLAETHDMAVAARAARHGAERTASMHNPRVGRAAYVRDEALQGVTDAGAEAVALIFEALANYDAPRG